MTVRRRRDTMMIMMFRTKNWRFRFWGKSRNVTVTYEAWHLILYFHITYEFFLVSSIVFPDIIIIIIIFIIIIIIFDIIFIIIIVIVIIIIILCDYASLEVSVPWEGGTQLILLPPPLPNLTSLMMIVKTMMLIIYWHIIWHPIQHLIQHPIQHLLQHPI